jgi:UDP-glucose 4-epimerase
MGMRVLVTGGGGFIGSNLVDELLHQGHSVRVLDNFSTGLRRNLVDQAPHIELIEGDLRDYSMVERAVREIEVVFHEAALPSVARSVEAPLTTDAVNVGGTLNVLNAASRAGVRRLVFASSSSVYGDSQILPKHESHPTRPMSPYAVSKQAGESYVRVFHRLYGLETVPLRYFNVFGPRQDPTSQYAGVIAKFISCALKGEPYPVHGDGTQGRDFTYIENVVAANLLAATAAGVDGDPMNVACGGRVTLLEMIAALNKITGQELPIVFSDGRAGDVKQSQADIARAREVLGYEPSVDFEQGLRRTFDWYARNASEHVSG